MKNILDFDVEDFISQLEGKEFREMLDTLLIKLQEYLPLNKIRCLYKGFTEQAIHYYHSAPEDGKDSTNFYFSSLLPENIRNELFLTKVERYFYINDLIKDNSAFSQRVLIMYPEARSILQFPFFVTSKNYFFLSFSSYVPNVFNYENIIILLEITKYLQNSFAEQYFELDSKFENILNSENMLGMCPDLAGINKSIEKIASRSVTVLILGETGVGKGVVAKAIHEKSKFSYGPFIKVNCGAIPETLLEAELFGYERGAFTGATSSKPGFFEQANNGTIFLDEIGDLPLSAQTKLLHVLEDQELRRVGGIKTIQINVRIIAATMHNLEEMVKTGKFRSDLWYRLNIYPISIPPLRERKKDISVLTKYFIKHKCIRENVDTPSISKDSLIKLYKKRWEGNVRELDHYIESKLIEYDYQPGKELKFDEEVEVEDILTEMLDSLFTAESLPSLDQFNAAYIRSTLKKCNWQIKGEKGAAKALGINPSTLNFKIKQLGITKKLVKTL